MDDVGTKKGLKLNVGRTLMVGLAFFTITMFWEVYDSIMPLFLLDFGLSGWLRGLVMALDNILALVLLPFMGLLSDNFPLKLRSKIGRRIPFIVCGSILAASCFLLLNFAHNARLLWLLIVSTAFVLVFMCLYRTPAVALMPDVTPKQIRSQGNTVINIMGTVGGVITLILITIFVKSETRIINGEELKFIQGNNWALVGIISALMIITSLVMMFKVKENKLVELKKQQLEELNIVEDDEEVGTKKNKVTLKEAFSELSKPELKSLFLILASVFLWYMAYNGVKTHFSVFAYRVMELEKFSLPLMVAQGAAFIMFVPASILGKKYGRKKTILMGVAMFIAGFALASIIMFIPSKTVFTILMYPAFVLVGGGWATINVHSYVMSVEMASEKTTGTYTGLYYTFAMSAQIITPILAGFVMDWFAQGLMIYSLIFACLAFVTMFFVKHGNAKDKPIIDGGNGGDDIEGGGNIDKSVDSAEFTDTNV